jgi:hypothetical protein
MAIIVFMHTLNLVSSFVATFNKNKCNSSADFRLPTSKMTMTSQLKGLTGQTIALRAVEVL